MAKPTDEIVKFMDAQPNNSEFLKGLVSDFIDGKLIYGKTQDAKLNTKIKKLKVGDLTLKLWDRLKQAGYTIAQLEDFVEGGKLELPENKTFYPQDSEPIIQSSSKANPQEIREEFQKQTNTITHKPTQILQEDGTLRCKRCNKRVEMRAFDFEQLDDYRKHCEEAHGGLGEEERNELMELYN